jgi:hypothetical protein
MALSDKVVLGVNSSGEDGSVVVGNAALASGDYGVSVGNNVNAQNINTVAIGRNTGATGPNSVALGVTCNGTDTGELAYNNGTFTSGSYAGRISWNKIWTQTTDDTPTLIGLSNSDSPVTNNPSDTFHILARHNTIAYDIDVLARCNEVVGSPSIPSINCFWNLKFVVAVDEEWNVVRLVGSVVKTVIAADVDASTWNLDVDLSDLYAIKVIAYGETDKTIRWVGNVKTTRCGFDF